jgi:hypothetical protein
MIENASSLSKFTGLELIGKKIPPSVGEKGV